jgi:hypothetical protein
MEELDHLHFLCSNHKARSFLLGGRGGLKSKRWV